MIEVQFLKIAELVVDDKALEFFVKMGISKDTNAAVWDTFFLYDKQVISSTSTEGATRICVINEDQYKGELIYSDLGRVNPYHWGSITKI